MTLECWQKKTTHQYINKVTKPRLELEQRVMLGPRHCRPLLLLCRRHCHVSSAQRAAGSVDGGEEPVGSAELKRKLQPPETLTVCGQTLKTDSQTNLTPRVLGLVGRDLHLQKHHPMGIIKQRIVNVSPDGRDIASSRSLVTPLQSSVADDLMSYHTVLFGWGDFEGDPLVWTLRVTPLCGL